jgi:hypothetical protein
MLGTIMFSVVFLFVVMLSVIMLNAVAPNIGPWCNFKFEYMWKPTVYNSLVHYYFYFYNQSFVLFNTIFTLISYVSSLFLQIIKF